jgi:hypothetical protein
MLKCCAFLFSIILFVSPVLAANHYISPNATGRADGSDWTNAWRDLPSNFVRGDTYFVSDGTYGSHSFSTPTSGTSTIKIVKATVGEHGTNIGWVNSMGDGVAVFESTSSDYIGGLIGTTLGFESGYWVFDGVNGKGESGHGFKVTTSRCGATTQNLITISGSQAISNVRISHVEMEHCGMEIYGAGHTGVYTFSPNGDESGFNDNINFDSVYIHHFNNGGIKYQHTKDSVFENSVIAYRKQNSSDTSAHGQAMPNRRGGNVNLVIRNNVFHSIYGTNFLSFMDTDAATPWENIFVYGNVFYQTDNNKYGTSGGTISCTGGDEVSRVYVFNNTFYRLLGKTDGAASATGVAWQDGNSGDYNVTMNNLFVDSARIKHSGHGKNGKIAYNTYSGCSSFAGSPSYDPSAESGYSTSVAKVANKSSYDLRLTASTDAGRDLTRESWWNATYCTKVDPAGNIRGNDGNWDRGAYEYVSGSGTIGVQTPSNLTVVGQDE